MPETRPDPLRERLRGLPKPELHVHALGAMRPTTILELARRTDAKILPVAERGAAEGFSFEDLPAFVEFFIGLFELVLDAESFARVTEEVLLDAALGGVLHAELRFSAWSHLSRGADERRMFDAIAAGRRAAERVAGISSRVILTFPRTLPVPVAEETLHVALRQRSAGVVAIDIAGDEQSVQADPRFVPVFARARREGLGITAHAGEGAGAESVAGALDLYGTRRVGHGTRAIEDPALVARLAREGVLLEVCPSSNVALGVVPSIARHPVVDFLAAGVPCTLGTDDPTLFGVDLLAEHAHLRREAGVPLAALGRMAAAGFAGAFVDRDGPGRALGERLAACRAAALGWAASDRAEEESRS